jgi:hypothetical protein
MAECEEDRNVPEVETVRDPAERHERPTCQEAGHLRLGDGCRDEKHAAEGVTRSEYLPTNLSVARQHRDVEQRETDDRNGLANS